MRDPARELFAARSASGKKFGKKGDLRSDFRFTFFPEVACLVLLRPFLSHAGDRGISLGKEGGELVEILLLPAITELVIVALHAIEADPEKGSCRPRGELCFVRAATARYDRDGDEVRLGMARPEALGRDELPHQFVVGAVDRDLISQPGHQPSSPIDKERARLDPDESPRKTLRKVVRIATVGKKVIEPGIYRVSASRQGLESANLLQRGRCTGQGEGEAPCEGERIGRRDRR